MLPQTRLRNPPRRINRRRNIRRQTQCPLQVCQRRLILLQLISRRAAVEIRLAAIGLQPNNITVSHHRLGILAGTRKHGTSLKPCMRRQRVVYTFHQNRKRTQLLYRRRWLTCRLQCRRIRQHFLYQRRRGRIHLCQRHCDRQRALCGFSCHGAPPDALSF